MFWKAVLILAAGCCGSTPATVTAESWMDSISTNFRMEMAGVLDMAVVNYTTPVLNRNYKSNLTLDLRAMGPLYNASYFVIDAIVEKDAYPEGLFIISDWHIEMARPFNENWRVLLAHYAGPVAFITIALLLVVILPLAGLFWCCCYCCRGGQRRRPFDRKYDSCLKGMLTIILIALLTLYLFGVVCTFATEQQVEEGKVASLDSLQVGVQDVQEFLNDTQSHAHWLLVNNYRELERKLNAMLTSSGLTISVQLGEFSRAVSVTTLTSMVRQLDGVQQDLRSVRTLTAALRHDAERLNAVLRSVKGQLLQTLARCDQPQCIHLQEKHKIGQLDTEIHYSQMPDVTDLLNNVTELLDNNIKQDVEEGQRVFRKIQREIQRSVDEHIPSLQETLTSTGRRLENVANEITRQTEIMSRDIKQYTDGPIMSVYNTYLHYGDYRRYVGVLIAVALLLVMVVLVYGLLCGVCGKRLDVYGPTDTCNKGAGSKLLLCGVAMMFVVGACVALMLAVYFLVGVVGQRFLCDPLTEPRNNRLFADVERLIDLEKTMFNEHSDPDFNITYVMLRCHENRTIYDVLQLHRLYELAELRRELTGSVRARAAALRPQYGTAAGRLTILRADAKRKLRQLADTGLSDFDFDRILHALETNMTSLSLDALAAQLEGAAQTLSERSGFGAVAVSLRNASRRLAAAHSDTVLHMLADTARLNTTALKLRDGLRFNHTSLKEAISYLLHETSQAETFLNTHGPVLLQNMTREFADVIATLVDEYLHRVELAVMNDVGNCGPMSHAFNVTRDTHCRKILMPINGFWMSLSWCILLFVPMMMVAQRLARLYLHVDPYPGPLVEAGSKSSTLDIEGKIAMWRDRNTPSAPPEPSPAPPAPHPPHSPHSPHTGTQLCLEGQDIVCQLITPPAALIDDLKIRLDAKDEDNDSKIHGPE